MNLSILCNVCMNNIKVRAIPFLKNFTTIKPKNYLLFGSFIMIHIFLTVINPRKHVIL